MHLQNHFTFATKHSLIRGVYLIVFISPCLCSRKGITHCMNTRRQESWGSFEIILHHIVTFSISSYSLTWVRVKVREENFICFVQCIWKGIELNKMGKNWVYKRNNHHILSCNRFSLSKLMCSRPK